MVGDPPSFGVRRFASAPRGVALGQIAELAQDGGQDAGLAEECGVVAAAPLRERQEVACLSRGARGAETGCVCGLEALEAGMEGAVGG